MKPDCAFRINCRISFFVIIPSTFPFFVTSTCKRENQHQQRKLWPESATRTCRRPSFLNISMTVSIGVWSVTVMGAWSGEYFKKCPQTVEKPGTIPKKWVNTRKPRRNLPKNLFLPFIDCYWLPICNIYLWSLSQLMLAKDAHLKQLTLSEGWRCHSICEDRQMAINLARTKDGERDIWTN